MKTREMNYELIRVRLIDIYEEYNKEQTKKAALIKMEEVAKEYEDVLDLLDDTLNCAIGIMDAISKGEIKDKKEEESLIGEILKELKEKSYLGGGE
ncbi:hypothetical protein A3K73_04910 [Candidatus Pacearchaeota archaeon RBG_13_36_9]|nr:MAG: hypothetical protein A3K73_04910 [Candidatus Pacearchaeota archaeon RBG_13_36_9]